MASSTDFVTSTRFPVHESVMMLGSAVGRERTGEVDGGMPIFRLNPVIG